MNTIYVKGDKISIQDPTIELLPFLLTLDPSFTVSSFQPSKQFIPRFQQCRRTLISGIDRESFHENSMTELERLHSVTKTGGNTDSALTDFSVSLLHLKKEISFKGIRECKICAQMCKVDRYNKKGKCGLDYRAFHSEPFIHIAEESAINPAIVVNFAGCSWDCVYCIDHELNGSAKPIPLNIDNLWSKIHRLLQPDCPMNTFEFAGGNPTESLHWSLEILLNAPNDFNLPIVWNCNPYTTDDSLKLLNGVVDVYLVDFRYGNDKCAKRLSKIDNFWHHSTNTIESMINQNAKVIIRMLVLPNHLDCCHEKTIEWLAQHRDHIWVSILDQYIPEHLAKEFSDINRRPTSQEIEEVERLVQKYGLRDIKEHPEDFWK